MTSYGSQRTWYSSPPKGIEERFVSNPHTGKRTMQSNLPCGRKRALSPIPKGNRERLQSKGCHGQKPVTPQGFATMQMQELRKQRSNRGERESLVDLCFDHAALGRINRL